MPSRSNPNTPTSHKPKTAHRLKSKRRHTQHLLSSSRRTPTSTSNNGVTKKVPRTSQALRQAAPLSAKKKRKLEKKVGFERARREERERERDIGKKEVVMRDV